MNSEELRKQNTTELKKMVSDLQKRLSDARFRFSANQVKNVKEIGNMKKEIARILTIIKEIQNHA